MEQRFGWNRAGSVNVPEKYAIAPDLRQGVAMDEGLTPARGVTTLVDLFKRKLLAAAMYEWSRS
jgi:hypothetical protein